MVKLVTESQHRGREIQQLQDAITSLENESGRCVLRGLEEAQSQGRG